jgi:hypothetical protein
MVLLRMIHLQYQNRSAVKKPDGAELTNVVRLIELNKKSIRLHKYLIELFTFDWAGLAILTGFLIKEKYSFHPWTIIIFIIIALLYIYFQWGLFKSSRLNQTRRFFYLEDIHRIMKIELPEKYNVKPDTSKKYLLKNWSHLSQIIITLMFLIISCCVLTGN